MNEPGYQKLILFGIEHWFFKSQVGIHITTRFTYLTKYKVLNLNKNNCFNLTQPSLLKTEVLEYTHVLFSKINWKHFNNCFADTVTLHMSEKSKASSVYKDVGHSLAIYKFEL